MAKTKGRSAWWGVHSWVGLKLSAILTFILATGTLATVSNEIDWLLTPVMRSAAPADAPVAWRALHATALAHADGGRVEILRAPIGPGFAAQASVALPSGETRRIWANPVDGRFAGTTSWRNVQQVLRQLHRRLILPNALGYFIVSLFSVLLGTLLVTGLVSYKRFWRGFLRLPQYRRGRLRQFAGDLHRFAALWSLWFVAIIAVTGMLYLTASIGIEPSGASLAAPQSAVRERTTLDQCLDLLGDRVRGLDIALVVLPETPGDPLVAMGRDGAVLTADTASRVAIDPTRCTIVKTALAGRQNAVARLYLASNPLHFGTFGGLFTKLLWFALGTVVTGISLTGSIIYACRIGREVGPPGRGALTRWRHGLGIWAYPTFGLVIFALVLLTGALSGPVAFALDDWHLW
ncbi:putative iron-regulated membrane protein [Sphingomonas sp. PvP055]|uniref:PepSY-associated TM helix domain-containing protein n=1 Tax=Sphingomonas sp. PvP055 TaxID=3156391 RepID=UPI00339B7891